MEAIMSQRKPGTCASWVDCVQQLEVVCQCIFALQSDGSGVAEQLQQLARVAPVVLPLLLQTVAASFGCDKWWSMLGAGCGAAVAWLRCLPAEPAAAGSLVPLQQLLRAGVLLLEQVVERLSDGDVPGGRIAPVSPGEQRECVLGLLAVLRAAGAGHEPGAPASWPAIDAAACMDAWQRVALRLCAACEALLRGPLWELPVEGAASAAAASKWPQLWEPLPGLCAFGDSYATAGPLLLAVEAAPAGGAEQQQLFAALTSAVKAAGTLAATDPQAALDTAAMCAWAAAFMWAHCGSSCDSSSSGNGSHSSSCTGRAAEVPWLALLARMLHVAGGALAGALANTPAVAPAAAIATCGALLECLSCALSEVLHWASSGLAAAAGEQQQTTAAAAPEPTGSAHAAAAAAGMPDQQAQQWLQQLQQIQSAVQQASIMVQAADARAQQLSAAQGDSGTDSTGATPAAAGSPATQVLRCIQRAHGQQLQQQQRQVAAEDAAALAMLQAGRSGAELLRALQSSTAVSSVPEQLRALAADMSRPHSFACNSPACANLTKASELELVSGKGCICAGCRTARYCSDACQVAHWPQHRPVCRRIKQQQAAAAAAAVTAEAPSADV